MKKQVDATHIFELLQSLAFIVKRLSERYTNNCDACNIVYAHNMRD